MTAGKLGDRRSYISRGETLSSTEYSVQGEEVFAPLHLLTTSRLNNILKFQAQRDELFGSIWADGGGHDVNVNTGRLYNQHVDVQGSGAQISLVPTSYRSYNTSNTEIAGQTITIDPDTGAYKTFYFSQDDLADVENVPYENAIGGTYKIMLTGCYYPSQAQPNPRTGVYQYISEKSRLGVNGVPTAVTFDPLTSTVTFKLKQTFIYGNGSSLEGRSGFLWKKDPETETAGAILPGLVTWDGVDNFLTATGTFGQDVFSTNAADYAFVVLGPVIFRDDAGAIAFPGGPVAIGKGNNNTSWDTSDQIVWPTIHSLVEGLIDMTPAAVTGSDKASIPKLSVVPSNQEAGSSAQLTVWQDSGKSAVAFQVTKDGDVSYSGDFLQSDPSNPFSVGVVTSNSSSVETALIVKHLIEPGNGASGIGVAIEFQVETDTGVVLPCGTIESRSGALDGASGIVEGTIEFRPSSVDPTDKSRMMISSTGQVIIDPDIDDGVTQGYFFRDNTDALFFQPKLIVSSDDTLTSMAIFNRNPSDFINQRGTKLLFTGRSSGLAQEVIQGEIEAHHASNSADYLSYMLFKVNDGGGQTSVQNFLRANSDLRSDFFGEVSSTDDFAVTADHGVMVEDASVNNSPVLTFKHKSSSTSDVTTGFGLTVEYKAENADNVDTLDTQTLWRVKGERTSTGQASVTTGYGINSFGGYRDLLLVEPEKGFSWEFGPGGLTTSAPFPWEINSTHYTPYTFVVTQTSAAPDVAGISIVNNFATDVADERNANLNFNGAQFSGTLYRMAGIEARNDGAGYEGHLELFTNDGSGSKTDRSNKAHLYSDGGFKSQTSSRGYVRFEDTVGSGGVVGTSNITIHGTKWFTQVEKVSSGGDDYYVATIDPAHALTFSATPPIPYHNAVAIVTLEDVSYRAAARLIANNEIRIDVAEYNHTGPPGWQQITINLVWFSSEDV